MKDALGKWVIWMKSILGYVVLYQDIDIYDVINQFSGKSIEKL